jgi:hypothetical protein
MNTTIHCAANIGLDYNAVVKRDMQRVSSNKSIHQEYLECRYNAVDAEEDMEHYRNIQSIKSRLRGRFVHGTMRYHDPDYEEEEVDDALYDYDDSSE